MDFNSDEYIYQKQLELSLLLFKNCLSIENFMDCRGKKFEYDFIQSDEFMKQLETYRKALNILFGSTNIRSLMNCASSDKRQSVNIIKQLLKFFNYKLVSHSEYQSTIGGKKFYKTLYTIENNNDIDNE